MASNPQSAKEIANALSDHNVQVDPSAKAVSQNLQGPYAIKPHQSKMWVFDLPKHIKVNDSNFRYDELSEMTGLTQEQCKELLRLMRQNPMFNKHEMIKELKKIGIGDALGQGRYRLSIETNLAYERRMHQQISALIASVEGGANVLNLQEQPYDGIDPTRMKIFEKVMEDLGYCSVARLASRDIGIWVKKDLARNFKKPSNLSLIEQVESSPLRGCLMEDNNYLYINLHVDRCGADELIGKLIALKVQAENYAKQHKPKLNIVINGDMNLFQLTLAQRNRLTKQGFVVELVKGHENSTKPNCEAYLLASSPISSYPSPSLYQSVSQSPVSLYSSPSQYPVSSQNQLVPQKSIILYKANTQKPQLAIKFASLEERAAFLETMDARMNGNIDYREQWALHFDPYNPVLFIPAKIVNDNILSIQIENSQAKKVFKELLGLNSLDVSGICTAKSNITIKAQSFLSHYAPLLNPTSFSQPSQPISQPSTFSSPALHPTPQPYSALFSQPSQPISQSSTSLPAAKNSQEIDVNPLENYIKNRDKGGNGFTLFGGFTKDEKIGSVNKLIEAITHYNTYGNLDKFTETLSLRERNALLEGTLYRDVVQPLITNNGNSGHMIESWIHNGLSAGLSFNSV